MNALWNQKEDFVEAEPAMRLFNLSADRVWASHQFQGHPLTELTGPLIPKPFHIFKLLLSLQVCGCADGDASPCCFVALRFFDTVLSCFSSVGLPKRLTEIEFVAQDNRSSSIFRPKQSRLH